MRCDLRKAIRLFFLPERGVARPAAHAIVAAAGAAIGLAVALTGPLQRVEWNVYDAFMRHAASTPDPSPGVVVVALDELSFAEINLPWPWPRHLHAQLVNAIAAQHPASIALDIVFDTPGAAPDGDVALASAIKAAGAVTLASDLVGIEDPRYSVVQRSDPLPALAEAAAGIGLATLPRDPDGVIRRAVLAIDGRPTLVAATLATSGVSLPADRDGARLVRFNGPPRLGIPTVSYYQALDASRLLPAGYFNGKHVFVGRSLGAPATDEADHFATPVSPQMAGVEIHATIADAVLRQRFIHDPFAALTPTLVACLAMGILFAAVTFRLAPGVAALVIVALSVLLMVSAYGALAMGNFRVPAVAPILTGVGAFAAGAAYRFALGNRERRLIARAFKHFVAPAIVDQMLNDPSRLKLGGEAYDVTVLFTDLEGFTSFAERLPPERLTALLTEYFRPMIDCVLAERGTLDKLIGDAIMAFFGCPIPDPDHPIRACRAALAMQWRLRELNSGWAARGLAAQRMRIGINTGSAVAGNMGTDTIFNYTVMGDAVNLASRLEGANKDYGTLILIGPETRRRVGDRFECRELDWIRVKGKQERVAIYELMAEAGGLTQRQRNLAERYAAGLNDYRAARWDHAARHFAAALVIDPDDGPSRRLAARCTHYATAPPPSWEGVHVVGSH